MVRRRVQPLPNDGEVLLGEHRLTGIAITTVQTVGASVGAAVLAAILQSRVAHHADAPARAFADTFWWIFAVTLLTLVPASLLPLRRGTGTR
ncbi:hypothetical protein AB0L06_41470 [Spirillospora sp. NPDC052269]